MKRADIAKMVRPFADRLADDMTKLVEEHVGKMLDSARERAMASLREQLAGGGMPADEAPVVRRDVKPEKAIETTRTDRRAAIAAVATSKALPAPKRPSGRSTMRCSKCGELGFRSDGCGRTHNVVPKMDDDGDDEDEGPAVLAAAQVERVAPTAPKRGTRESMFVNTNTASTGQRKPKRSPDVERAITIAPKKLTRAVLDAGWAEVEVAGPAVEEPRPRVRGDCVGGERPCPWVGCRHHLYLDVDRDRGLIKINFPDAEPDELAETCSLDVADKGGQTLIEVGAVMNLTRERTRQLEVHGLLKLRARVDRDDAVDLAHPVSYDEAFASAGGGGAVW